MKYIEYIDEEGIIDYYSEEDFIDEAWHLPFNFVLNEANKNKELKDILMEQLFLRASEQPYIKLISKNNYYHKLRSNIINSNDIEKKVHLVLYYEPQLLHSLFKNVNNLVNSIISNTDENTFLVDIADKFVKISTLYTIDNDILNRIIYFLENIAKNECIRMTNYYNDCVKDSIPSFNKDTVINNINDIKNKYIDIICNNKLKYSKVKKLH